MTKLLAICVSVLLLSGYAFAQDQPAKESKDEALYKGKPASFWIKQLKDRDVSFRLDAVKALREIGTEGEGVVLALVNTLTDKEQTVQDAAREAIGSLPLEGRIPALVQILRGKDKAVRPATIELLGKVGSQAKDAIPDLTKALADEDANIRSRSANALGKIGVSDKSALTALVKLLDDKDTSVRFSSTRAFGEIGKGTEVAIPSLLERLSPKKEEDASIRLEAVKTLWAIGKPNDKVLSAILVACSDTDERVSTQARKSISDVDMKQRVPILAQSLKTDDNKIRLIALSFLVEIGAESRKAVPAVVELLTNDEESIRIQAAKMLGKVGKDAAPATPGLIGLLADKSAQVRAEVANALKAIPIDGKLPALVAALKDKNAEIRAYAVGELEEVGPDAKGAVPALIPLLQGKDVRLSAAKALGKIGLDAKDAIPSLAKMLDEDDEAVRIAALAALRNLGPEARVPVLIGTLRDKEEASRQQAASELAKLGPKAKAAIPALGRALDDPNPTVCTGVASALAAMGKDSVPPLIEYLKGKGKNRAAAARALGEIGPDAKAGIPVLATMVEDSDEILQSAATVALSNLGPEARVPALIGSLRDKNVSINGRVKAAKTLGLLGGEAKSAIPALFTAFAKDHQIYGSFDFSVSGRDAWEFYETYETALKRIGAHDVPQLIEILKRTKIALRNNDNGDVRTNSLILAFVTSTLGEIGVPDAKAAVPVLMELLEDGRCRVSAALALGQMGGPEAKAAVPALLDIFAGYGLSDVGFLFEEHENYLKATSKAEAIRAKRDTQIRPRLQGSEYERIKQLERMVAKTKDIQRQIRNVEDRNVLLRLRRENEFVRKSAITAIKRMDKDSVLPLIAILKGESQHRPLAAIILVELFPVDAKEAIPIFVDLLENAKTHRAVYAFALGKLGGPQGKAALPYLVGVLGDDDDFVKEATAAAIKGIGKDAVPVLIQKLKDKDRGHILAMGALGEIGSDAKPAVPILLKLHQDENYRVAAALALGMIGGPDAKDAIPVLMNLLKDADPHKRIAAATALGKVGKDAVTPLLAFLKGKNDNRFLAAYSLGEIGPDAKASIPVLVGLLDDDDKIMRMTAATALGKLGKEAVPALSEFLKKESPNRILAIHALGGIGPAAKGAIPAFLRPSELQKADDIRPGEKKENEQPMAARIVNDFDPFLNPRLLKIKTFDPLLETDPDIGLAVGIALAKIDSREAVRFLTHKRADRQIPDRRKEDRPAKLDATKELKAAWISTGIGPVLRELWQERTNEDEMPDEDSFVEALKKEAEKDRLIENTVVNTLKAPALIELLSLKERGTFSTALALARISPEAAKDLKLSISQTERRPYDQQESQITDAELRELAPFKNLAGLNLDRTKVTDAGMKMLPNFKRLSKLSLDSTAVTNKGVREIASLDSLTVLEIGGTRVTDAGLKEIAKLKNLSTLDLGGTKVTDAGLNELAKLPNLSSLGLAYTDVTDVGLKELANFKNLSLLDLRGTQVTEAGLKELASLNNLTTLIVSFQLTDAGLKDLSYLRTLTRLPSLSSDVTDAGLKELGNLKNLTRLDLNGTKITDAGLKELGNLKNLSVLDLRGTLVTDVGIKEMTGFKNLSTLVLSGTKVTSAGLKDVANLKNLSTLDLDQTQVTDATLHTLGEVGLLHVLRQAAGTDYGLRPKSENEIVSLYLSGTKVTDAGLNKFTGLKNLSTLDLSGTKVTDAGLKELTRLMNLQTLYLSRTELTDAGLKEFAGLKNLRTLDLSGTTVSDAGLKQVAALNNLSTLRLSGTKVTDAGLKELTSLKKLRTFDLRDTNTTDAGLEELRKALPEASIYK